MDETQVLVVGGGNAGISLAARLLRGGADGVTVVAPQPLHRYKPLLNYVGGGEATMADLERPTAGIVPDGCRWVRDSVEAVDADAMTVRTRGGQTLHCSTLVLCPGLVEDWDATPGLQPAYADGWVASTYVPGSAPQVWPRLTSLRSGSVVFTVPPEPASCGPTALKPLFMACDHWRRTGALADLRVRLLLPARHPTDVREADEILDRAFADYGIEVLRETRIADVDWASHAITVTSPAGRQVLEDVDFAHAVPHYRAPSWIADAGLAADPTPGLVDVDPTTLRSRRHGAIWSIGDAAALATRPSGGALRRQVEILVQNMAAARDGKPLQRYDGYTVMPITVSRRKLLLAEVDRDSRPTPSVPFLDPMKPRRATWFADRYLLPRTYWRRILRGKL
ncbi:NAD(P)/FAD-dependent oxidoreductase [Blastococcus sp. PRF04-17]|uniref:NAD(P)/FAD-dependent oxidoreductase n=1 Tax=Blastococcus sp. PRF04-17 TaxID=2933797 RepID=UPI001FF36CED|nr:FAD/NAD(P)-binding oxidoreductase [Blastococcus sp. PRF04-17]UOY03877.1 NAD(P)/FAD-dependent oxidoreductase [Blastococcus sp. PRF04-17]